MPLKMKVQRTCQRNGGFAVSCVGLLVEKGIPYEAITEELARREGLISKTTDRPEIKNL